MEAQISNKQSEMLILQEVTSTNDILWQRFSQHHLEPAACIAETQTAGRGRRGDVWQSPSVGNLYLSLFWPHCAEEARHGLSIAIGISLINTLKQSGINQLALKWPNDVLYKRSINSQHSNFSIFNIIHITIG